MPHYVDIAVNLGDPMFRGRYHGKQKHADDLADVLARAKDAGVQRMILTGTSLEESRVVLELAKEFDQFCTAGCHPTSTPEIDAYPGGVDAYFAALEALIEADREGDRRIISVGEVGLDYDRLQFAPRETQLAHLARLLVLSQRFTLPLFLHSRHPDAHTDLVRTLRAVGYGRTWPRAVVHSFTGTTAEMQQLVEMGLYIGMNGCSLKTEPNLAVARAVPLHRLCVETDAPWCSITSTSAAAGHYAAVVDKVKPDKLVLGAGKGAKGRNEPAEVVAVAQVLANVRGEDGEVFARAVWGNTLDVFWPGEVER